jgi:hypothetical protein
MGKQRVQPRLIRKLQISDHASTRRRRKERRLRSPWKKRKKHFKTPNYPKSYEIKKTGK